MEFANDEARDRLPKLQVRFGLTREGPQRHGLERPHVHGWGGGGGAGAGAGCKSRFSFDGAAQECNARHSFSTAGAQ